MNVATCNTTYNGNLGWSNDPSAAQAREMSPVESGILSVQSEQGNTYALLDELVMRLDMVLRPIEEQAVKGGPQAVRASHSVLHSRLNEALEMQVALNDRIRSITARLTV